MACLAERLRAELLAHAELRDHLLRELGRTVDVVGRTGGDVADGDLLGDAPAHERCEVGKHLGLGAEELLFLGQVPRRAERCGRAG